VIEGPRRPNFVGAAEGPDDLGRYSEAYLRKLVEAR
jgi:hypothetical protein